jgi:VanZ family protein
MLEVLEEKRSIAILLTIVIALEIFFISSIPGGRITPPGRAINVATIYHLVVFFLFNFFLLISIIGNEKIRISKIILVLIISFLYSFLDEFHQMFIPFREASIRDLLINSIGILFSTIIYLKIKRSRE